MMGDSVLSRAPLLGTLFALGLLGVFYHEQETERNAIIENLTRRLAKCQADLEARRPLPPPPAVSDLPPFGRSPLVYPSADHTVSLPGLYVGEPANPYSLDRYDTLAPAADLTGSLLVRGPAVFEGPVFVETDPGNFTSLAFLIETLRNLPGLAGNPCVHGFATFPNGTCVCQEFWEGPECDASTCFGRGTWDPGRKACVCVAGYNTSTFCASPQLRGDPLTVDTCRPTNSTGEYGAWIGNQGQTCGYICPAGFYMFPDTLDPTGFMCSATPPVEPATGPDCSALGDCSGHGICLTGNTCACVDEGWLGPRCDRQCASPVINASQCPERANWGWDWYGTVQSTPAFVCGGGYQFEASGMLQIGVMECTLSAAECEAVWDADHAVCCAPGVVCSAGACGASDAVCCATAGPTEAHCHAAGCTWCPSSETTGSCGARELVGSSECTSDTLFRSSLHWGYTQFDCSAVTQETPILDTACDAAVRQSYLSLYQPCLGNWTRSCLSGVRAEINKRAWPRLASSTELNPSRQYYVQLDQTRADAAHALERREPPCPRPSLTVEAASVSLSLEAAAVPARWTCETGTPLWIVPSSTQRGDSAPEYYLMALWPHSLVRACLVVPPSSSLSWQEQAQALAPGPLPGGRTEGYWRRLQGTYSPLDYTQYCSSLPLSDTMSALGNNASVVYGLAGPPYDASRGVIRYTAAS